MRSVRRRGPLTSVVLLVVGTFLGLAGCVAIPTIGPIERVGGQQPACQNCVNVEVAPPAIGAGPGQIVKGYLRATSNFQPGYSVARQFLTKTARETWSPEGLVLIYKDQPVAKQDTVTLRGPLVGTLGEDRTFRAGGEQRIGVTFKLEKENGEWRISNPRKGLVVSEYSFRTFYKPYDLYYVGNGVSLVPDPIYLPALRSPQNVASALVNALLAGPSRWLAPAVRSAIPTDTTLSVNSVTITDGVADVPLSESMLALTDAERSLVAAQVVYTLKQAGIGIKGVVIRVNDQKLRMPGGDPNSQVISIDAVPHEMEPLSFVSGDQLYAVRATGSGAAVQRVVSNDDAPSFEAITNDVGDGRYSVNSLAVSVADTDIAVVTDGRTVVRRAPTRGGQAQKVALKATELLRPQFTRYGELWMIGQQGGQQHIWMMVGKSLDEIKAPPLSGGTILAFRISPDGTRMALIRKVKDAYQLGLARITRVDGKVMVDGWRTLDIALGMSSSDVQRLVDVVWIDPTDLLVLGRPNKDAAIVPYRISEDGSRVTSEGESENWGAKELAVLIRNQSAIVVGTGGQTWKDDGSNWVPYVDGVVTVAYPG